MVGNMNIKEDYVSREIYKLLIEKGFDSEIHTIFDKEGYTQQSITLQMAIKWLEKEKHIAIIPILSSILDDEKFLWDVKIVVAETGEKYSQGWIYEDKESAYNAAIKYCLENLI